MKKGADLGALSSGDDLVSNAIHLAAYFGYLPIVKFIIETKPDLMEVENKDEKTAFALAKEEKRQEICDYLIEKGANTVLKKRKF